MHFYVEIMQVSECYSRKLVAEVLWKIFNKNIVAYSRV